VSQITREQAWNVLTAHAYRVCNSMDYKDLLGYAVEMYCASFSNDAALDFDAVIEDICDYEGDDEELIQSFLSAQGLSPEAIKSLLAS
jgi:hypothetical protein